MSVEHHRAAGSKSVGCAVMTVSDTRTPDTDTGGRAVVDLLHAAGHIVLDHQLVPDAAAAIRNAITQWTKRDDVQAIITTGGTGIARRDGTFDALGDLFERTVPGFGELFRALSFQEIGAAAMLSRAEAGVIGGRIVFLLPGSEPAVRLAMTQLIVPELAHAVGELRK